MPNKPFDKLNDLDKLLRKTYASGPSAPNVLVTIEMIQGFEQFNTRPYHNYETWSDGYSVNDGIYRVREEDLDDAIKRLCFIHDNPIQAKRHEFILIQK